MMPVAERDQHVGIPQRLFAQPLPGIAQIGGRRRDALFAAKHLDQSSIDAVRIDLNGLGTL